MHIKVGEVKIPLHATIEEDMQAELGSVFLSSDEARVIFKKSLKRALKDENVKKLIEDTAVASILSTVRGYFTHGEGRVAIEKSVGRVIKRSSLMRAIKSL